jgi:hypothetical protein
MRRRTRFIPEPIGPLEDRLVLSHGAASRGASVLVGNLTPRHQVLNLRHRPVAAEVNLAFDQFQSDYGQARSTYFASILNQSPAGDAVSDATNAFKLYTTQRVGLLSQQIVSSFLQSSRGTSKGGGGLSSVGQLAATQLINPRSINANGIPNGALVQSLVKSIPTAGASASTQTLYSLSQDNAIELARVAVENRVNVLRNGDFGAKSSNRNH